MNAPVMVEFEGETDPLEVIEPFSSVYYILFLVMLLCLSMLEWSLRNVLNKLVPVSNFWNISVWLGALRMKYRKVVFKTHSHVDHFSHLVLMECLDLLNVDVRLYSSLVVSYMVPDRYLNCTNVLLYAIWTSFFL